MAWTKKQFIIAALDELAISNYEFDISPDELQSCLIKLDAMMAKWNARGIRIGYPIPPGQSSSSLDDVTNVPDSSIEAIYTNLAIRISPSFGKIVSSDTKLCAKEAYNILKSRAASPGQMQLPGEMPAGAGNKNWQYSGDPFIRPPSDEIEAGSDAIIEYN